MADISAEITAFRNAAYGEDVRAALISLANKVNTVVMSNADTIDDFRDDLEELKYWSFFDTIASAMISQYGEKENSITEWYQGSINMNTGANMSSDTRIRCNYIYLPEGCLSFVKIEIADGFQYRLYEYDTSTSPSVFITSPDWIDQQNKYIVFNPNHAYRIVIKRTDDTVITPSEYPSFKIKFGLILDSDLSVDKSAANASTVGDYFEAISEKTDNLFYLTDSNRRTINGVTIYSNGATLYVNGTASSQIAIELFGGTTSSKNVDSNTPYYFSRTLISGSKISGNHPYFQYVDSNTSRTTMNLADQPYIFDDNPNVILRIGKGASYDNAVYQFTFSKNEPIKFINSGLTAIDLYARSFIKSDKKSRSVTKQFFTLPMTRIYSFGDFADIEHTYDIDCVLCLPDTYTSNGTPTRLICACHGSGGYIKASDNYWWSDAWNQYVDAMLNAGYGLFDCNIYPWELGTASTVGEANGAPLYIKNLYELYSYINENYNVYDKIFVHGCSMGGVAATGFTHNYPDICLAESSFAGRDICLYLHRIDADYYDATSKLNFARDFGYTDFDALINDGFSKIIGRYPSLGLIRTEDGQIEFPPNNLDDFENFKKYYGDLETYTRTSEIPKCMGYRKVPYKAWNSWSDRVGDSKFEEILHRAYNSVGSCIYETIFYENWSHSQMCYGLHEDMNKQVVDWYKQFENSQIIEDD